MLNQFENYLTFENIYLCCTFGILPFWLLIIFFPKSGFTQFFINSIILPLILSIAYIYIINQAISMDQSFLDVFAIYLSLDNLYTLFSTESFLLVFWLHFLALNLFVGSWMSRDAVKYNMSRSLTFAPLILVYLAGPLGLVLYWFIRVFYAKKLGFHD